MTDSADPDQLASSEANWSGSTLFAKTGHVVFSKRRVKLSFCLSNITKTCLYNVDPLKPHFYIVKLGLPGVCIIFLISAQKICFELKYEKYQIFFIWKFYVFGGKVFNTFEKACIRNEQCWAWSYAAEFVSTLPLIKQIFIFINC